MGKVIVVGIGPGSYEDMTIRADRALQSCDAIVGYGVYVDLVKERYPDKAFYETPMTQEAKRCALALELARAGKTAAMVCSGDSGIYGMAALVYELRGESEEPEIEVVPGLTAACSAAALLGAPLTHDFAVISLSDRLTPWETIEKRLTHAAKADCGIARNIGRAGESWRTLTLGELREAEVDMFCTVIVGNVSTKEIAGRLITPRGYKNV